MNDAEYIKSIRKALHLTQAEMADKLGYSSQEVVSAIETSKRNMSEGVRAHLRTIEKHELLRQRLRDMASAKMFNQEYVKKRDILQLIKEVSDE